MVKGGTKAPEKKFQKKKFQKKQVEIQKSHFFIKVSAELLWLNYTKNFVSKVGASAFYENSRMWKSQLSIRNHFIRKLSIWLLNKPKISRNQSSNLNWKKKKKKSEKNCAHSRNESSFLFTVNRGLLWSYFVKLSCKDVFKKERGTWYFCTQNLCLIQLEFCMTPQDPSVQRNPWETLLANLGSIL